MGIFRMPLLSLALRLRESKILGLQDGIRKCDNYFYNIFLRTNLNHTRNFQI